MKTYFLRLNDDFINLMDEVENVGKVAWVFSMIPRLVAIQSRMSAEELEKYEFVDNVEEVREGAFF